MVGKVSYAVSLIEAGETRSEHVPRRNSQPSRGAKFPAVAMAWWRAASVLLTHVNVLLAMFAGGALVTAARLKWDPSTYVPVRQLFPEEYRVAAAMMVGGGCVLLLLANLGVAALHTSSPAVRRVLLVVYAAALGAVMCAEVAWCGWTALRLRAWLHSPPGQHLFEAIEFRESVRPIQTYLGRWFSVAQKVNGVIEEAEADAPRNLYAVAAGAALLALLQALGLLAASALVACAPRHSRHPRHSRRVSHSWATTSTTLAAQSSEKAPLRTAYRNGRIVIL